MNPETHLLCGSSVSSEELLEEYSVRITNELAQCVKCVKLLHTRMKKDDRDKKQIDRDQRRLLEVLRSIEIDESILRFPDGLVAEIFAILFNNSLLIKRISEVFYKLLLRQISGTIRCAYSPLPKPPLDVRYFPGLVLLLFSPQDKTVSFIVRFFSHGGRSRITSAIFSKIKPVFPAIMRLYSSLGPASSSSTPALSPVVFWRGLAAFSQLLDSSQLCAE